VSSSLLARVQKVVLTRLWGNRQQAVSGIVKLPSDMFQGSGKQFKKIGMSFLCGCVSCCLADAWCRV
jgi:hypothetical protein